MAVASCQDLGAGAAGRDADGLLAELPAACSSAIPPSGAAGPPELDAASDCSLPPSSAGGAALAAASASSRLSPSAPSSAPPGEPRLPAVSSPVARMAGSLGCLPLLGTYALPPRILLMSAPHPG